MYVRIKDQTSNPAGQQDHHSKHHVSTVAVSTSLHSSFLNIQITLINIPFPALFLCFSTNPNNTNNPTNPIYIYIYYIKVRGI